MITKHEVKNIENMYRFYFFIPLVRMRTDFKAGCPLTMETMETMEKK